MNYAFFLKKKSSSLSLVFPKNPNPYPLSSLLFSSLSPVVFLSLSDVLSPPSTLPIIFLSIFYFQSLFHFFFALSFFFSLSLSTMLATTRLACRCCTTTTTPSLIFLPPLLGKVECMKS